MHLTKGIPKPDKGDKTEIENLTPREVVHRRKIEKAFSILDVRERWEVKLAAVPGTINIPMDQVAKRMHELDENLPLAVLCHGGVRSMKVARYLQQNGFKHVVNISGGIDAWSVQVDPGIPRY